LRWYRSCSCQQRNKLKNEFHRFIRGANRLVQQVVEKLLTNSKMKVAKGIFQIKSKSNLNRYVRNPNMSLTEQIISKNKVCFLLATPNEFSADKKRKPQTREKIISQFSLS